jgi:hypothetical protein
LTAFRIRCALGELPNQDTIAVSMTVVPTQAGDMQNRAAAVSLAIDADNTNNYAIEGTRVE